MKLSVIIPAHNEEKRIGETLKHVDSYLEKQKYEYEIIVVDNNSVDRTDNVAENLFETSVERARLIKERIPGKGAAVRTGVHNSTGDYVVFMDADNATPISEIEKFWSYFDKGYDVVIGSRYVNESNVTRKQPFYRIVLSRISNLLIQVLAVPGIHDTQLGFKAFSKQAAHDIFEQVGITGWGFDMEVLTIARIHGHKIKEVGVLWREFGGSHVPLKAYIQSLRDLLKIKTKAILGKYNPKDSATETSTSQV
ncbi:MAG: hypothetical protein A3J48_03945 [Candidatus Doudnabacteria bacterium RIFCSPHIGHO2_02_FULL_46_11]|uniref:dolichyl-phosphate beta-glucosyltransferase n=1 Tax=Candidatus Doudnabacteria bacterium RIFCSPHIGHO2_02_FULL_46_11 TaxID=1817832 RepID=A0A1F5P8A9_9BACT|nr:MAG: hypothetical protein A3J48_03945 [Candidatus Doudnabacteria bacterium RIFCSPHIGHO2_02_FULL_46_11]